MMSLEYVAGILDGEGYIAIDKNSSKGRCYIGKCVVQMADARIPKLMQSQFGGSYREYPRKGANQRDAKCWEVKGEKAIALLKKVIPFLILKKRSAELVVLLYKDKDFSLSRTHPSEAQKDYRDTLYWESRSLTRRGKSVGN